MSVFAVLLPEVHCWRCDHEIGYAHTRKDRMGLFCCHCAGCKTDHWRTR